METRIAVLQVDEHPFWHGFCQKRVASAKIWSTEKLQWGLSGEGGHDQPTCRGERAVGWRGRGRDAAGLLLGLSTEIQETVEKFGKQFDQSSTHSRVSGSKVVPPLVPGSSEFLRLWISPGASSQCSARRTGKGPGRRNREQKCSGMNPWHPGGAVCILGVAMLSLPSAWQTSLRKKQNQQ